jgi:ferredoxin
MTTESEYRVRLDRAACDGVFACLVRDERFVEAADGLATIEGTPEGETEDELTAVFVDDRIDDARQAARACPLDAITVSEHDGESGSPGERNE